jgi:2-methylcitrate dehydratase PrpD
MKIPFEGYKDIEQLRKKIIVKENPEFTETYYKFEKTRDC